MSGLERYLGLTEDTIKCGKDYEAAGSCDIAMLKDVHQYLHVPHGDLVKWHIEAAQRVTALFGYNKDKFLKLWGRQAFCWTGSSEPRRFYVWVHALDSCQLVVLTANVKGTCYEFVPHDENDITQCGKDVVKFLQGIIDKAEVENA